MAASFVHACDDRAGAEPGLDAAPLAPRLVEQAVDRAGGRRGVGQAVRMACERLIRDGMIDELFAGASADEEIVGPGGLLHS